MQSNPAPFDELGALDVMSSISNRLDHIGPKLSRRIGMAEDEATVGGRHIAQKPDVNLFHMSGWALLLLAKGPSRTAAGLAAKAASTAAVVLILAVVVWEKASVGQRIKDGWPPADNSPKKANCWPS